MQLLLSKAALDRVRDRLPPGDLDLVTIEKGPDREPVFRRAGEVVEAATVDPEAVWLSLDMYPAGLLPAVFPMLAQAPSATWAQGFMAGLDNPMFKMVMARGVRLTKSDAQAPAIAEYVMAHALALLHPIEAQAALQREHAWKRVDFREVASTRWLMLGFGAIGRQIAQRLKPFGAHLTVVRRSTDTDTLVDAVHPAADLPQLLPEADVVVLAAPLNDETRDLAGEAFFAAMKPGAILINIARGEIVDEEALKRGLDRDQPARAVLDVFRTEPLPADHWAWDHPKVRLTAHTSNAGNGLLARGDALFLDNLRRYMAGEPLRNEATKAEVGL